VYFRQLRLPDIGCASYIAGGEGVCAVIDPRWDAVPQYAGLARQQGLQITHILETHTHADHVSGATRLAARTGATILIHRNALVTYPHCDEPKPLTSRSCWCRIERMYEIERFSVSRHGRAVRVGWVSPRPVRLQVGREKPGEGNPNDPGQARSQEHARWWGYCWFQG